MDQSLRVLIVDDSDDDAVLLQHTLRRGGYEVTCEVVDTPDAMRTLLESQNWDVITSDHSMPHFSAPAALALARELRPDIPFIIVSGEIDLNLAVSLMKGGAQDYIQKRELPRLVPAVERELREVALRRESERADAALIESEIKYRSLIESSSDAIFCVNEAGQYQFTNQVFASTFGKPPDYFIGKTFWDVYPKEHADYRYEAIKRVFQTGESESFEVVVPLPDKTLYFYATNNPVKDETGKVILSLTHATDITQRKQAEDLLAQTRQNYEAFFNSIDEFLFVLDEQGNIIHTNSTVIDRLGYTREELCGKSVLMVHPAERRDEAGRIVGEMLNGTAEFCPVPIITKSGVQIPVETRVSHGCWDGKPAIFGVTKDISKIKLSEEKFSKIFFMNPSACGLSDLNDHKYVEVNEAFYALLGFDKNEVIGKTANDLGILSPEKADAVLQKADRHGNVTHVEAELKAKNGEIKHVQLSSENIDVQNKKYRFTVVDDITERKLAAEARREENILLEKMVIFAEELLKTDSEQVTYQKILENLLFISKAKYGALTLLNESTGKFTTVAVVGLNDKVKQVSKILGSGLEGKEWNDYSIENEYLKGQTVSHFSSMRELAGSVIPEMITRPIEKLLNMGEVAVTKVSVNHQMIGDFTLIMPAGKRFENDALVEIYSRQIDMFLTRIKAEAEIIKEKEDFELIFDTGPEANSITRLSDGLIVNANEIFLAMLGFTRDEIIGKSTPDLNIYENASDRQRIVQELDGKGYFKNDEVVFRRKDGSLFTGSVSAKNIMLHGVAHIFCSIRDITEPKRTEEALREAEWKFKALFEKGPIGVAYHEMIYDKSRKPVDYHFIDANETYQELTGVDPRGKNATEAFPGIENDPFDWIGTFGRVARTGEQIRFESYLQPNDSWYDCVAYQYKPDHFVAAFHNITRRKQAEEQVQRLNIELEERVDERTAQLTDAVRELEAFSYSVSHDLRAPLRSLEGYSNFLLEDHAGQLDEQGKLYLSRIQESSRRMGQLINDLLNLSQVTCSDFTCQQVDLSLLAHQVAAELKAQSPQRRVAFDIAANMTVQGDENLLKIVLENLLNNAFKFTSQRERASIQVGMLALDGKNTYFVRDNGAGYDMNYANKMFRPFQRLHTEKEFPGTGIGLATVKRIIQRHGGRVWAEGGVDQGATFYFTLM